MTVTPTLDFTRRTTRTAYFVDTVGAVRYHLDPECRGLERSDAPVKSADIEFVETSEGFELVRRGRLLCRICRGAH